MNQVSIKNDIRKMGNNRESNFQAFILAAGEGRRLKPYTDQMPKPMVPVNGQPILQHTLDHLAAAGVQDIIINTFHKGQVIKDFVEDHHNDLSIYLSEEEALLNTGLGIKRVLHRMKSRPFFVINGDAFWTNGPEEEALCQLENAWDPQEMDILLLLQPVNAMTLTKGVGDYIVDQQGRAQRQKDQAGDYMFAGIRICKPEIFDETPDTPFSFLDLMDQAESKGRLFALIHDGEWHHISTPGDLERVNESLAAGMPKEASA